METSVAKGEVQRYHKSLQEFLHRASLQGDEDGDTKLWVRRKTTEWYETRNDNANVDTSVYCLVYSSIRDEYKNVELFSAHFHDLLIWGGNMWFAWQPGWYQHALQNDRWGVFFHHALAFKHCLTSQYEKGEEEVGAPCVEMTSGQMEEKKKVACRKWQETCCYVGCGTTKLETGRWDTFKYCAKHVHFSFVRLIRHVEDDRHRPHVPGSGLFDLYLNVYAFPVGTTFGDEHICEYGHPNAIPQSGQKRVPSHIGPTASRLTRRHDSGGPCERYQKRRRKAKAALSPATSPPVLQFEHLRRLLSDSGSMGEEDEASEEDQSIDTAPRKKTTKKGDKKKNKTDTKNEGLLVETVSVSSILPVKDYLKTFVMTEQMRFVALLAGLHEWGAVPGKIHAQILFRSQPVTEGLGELRGIPCLVRCRELTWRYTNLACTKAGQDDIALWSIVPGIEGFPYYKALQKFENICTEVQSSLNRMIHEGVNKNIQEWQREFMKLAKYGEIEQKKINDEITDQRRHSLLNNGEVYHTIAADEDPGLFVGTVNERRRRMMELIQNGMTIWMMHRGDDNESWLASGRKAYEKQDTEKCKVHLLKLKKWLDTKAYTVQDLFTPNSPQRTKMYFFPSFHPYPYIHTYGDFGIPPVGTLLDLMHHRYHPDRNCEGCKGVLEAHLNLEALLMEQKAGSPVFWSGGLRRRWRAKQACEACRAVLDASSLLLKMATAALSCDTLFKHACTKNIDLGKRFVLDFHYVIQELPYFADAYDDQSWYETYNRVYASVGKA